MNHAFQLAARAVYLGNNPDIEKFSFELPYVKPNVSNNSSIGDDSSSGKLTTNYNVTLSFCFRYI